MNEKTLNRLLAVMVMVCCGNAVAQTTTNHTLIIKPNEHVSWSCELWPAQSAEVVFVPDSAPKGYVYEGMSIEKTQPNPGFCWTGAGDRYCILNSLAKSAVAMVKATCKWIPERGSGGGSGGAPLPVLIGTGIATAIAQPGTYWSTAGGANVLALGMGTVVKALKDQGAPADSEWTCTTDQLMILPFGDLTRVTATGIVTSASAWDANVHSESLDYKGLSDDEPFTVVSVASISAKPVVVCVGNSNIAYTIITAPTGFEYMVSYTPADTSTPDVKEVIATCGKSAATCTVTVVKVEIKKPSGNPGNPNEADEWNERSYNGGMPGIVTVECEAEETPKADNLRWKIADVGEIKATWDPHVDGNSHIGKGLKTTATFTGLPAHYTGFGSKTITLTMDGSGITSSDTQEVEIFFRRAATNNPGSDPWEIGPNWYYYSLQILPCIANTWRYMKVDTQPYWEPFDDPDTELPYAEGRVEFTDFGCPGNPFYYIAHENKHHTDFFDVIWQGTGYKAEEDSDGDGIRDGFEIEQYGSLDKSFDFIMQEDWSEPRAKAAGNAASTNESNWTKYWSDPGPNKGFQP